MIIIDAQVDCWTDGEYREVIFRIKYFYMHVLPCRMICIISFNFSTVGIKITINLLFIKNYFKKCCDNIYKIVVILDAEFAYFDCYLSLAS